MYPSHNASGIRRAANYLSFGISASTIGLSKGKRPDVVYVYHPPITAAWPAQMLRRFRGVPYVLHIQDLWPDAVMQSGMLGKRSRRLVERALSWAVTSAQHNASHIAVITPGFKERLVAEGLPADKVSVIMNWSPEYREEQSETDRSVYRKALGPSGSQILLFGGNLGPFQQLDLVIRRIASLPDESRIHLAIMGDGIERDSLRTLAQTLGTKRVTFLPRCSPDEALNFQRAADFLLVSLADHDFLRATIPSKTATSLALGKPILAISSGDTATLIDRAEAGLAVPPEPSAIDAALNKIADLDETELAMITAITEGLGDTAVSQERLNAVRLADSIPEYTRALERDWDRYVRQRQPRP
jgi:glycosyltransferase involved in cell wall biosynthesis